MPEQTKPTNHSFFWIIPLICAAALAFLHRLGMHGGYLLWWYDIMMHLLGGATIAFLALLVMPDFRRNESVRLVLCATFMASLIIGGVWEGFEYFNNLTDVLPGQTYAGDTVKDLIDDGIGAIIAAMVYLLVSRPMVAEELPPKIS